jgi:hypothetical protein
MRLPSEWNRIQSPSRCVHAVATNEGGRTRESWDTERRSDKRRRRGLMEASTSRRQHARTLAVTGQRHRKRTKQSAHAQACTQRAWHSGALRRRPVHGVSTVASFCSCVLCCVCCVPACACAVCMGCSQCCVQFPSCRPFSPRRPPPLLTHATEQSTGERAGTRGRRRHTGRGGTARSQRMQGARFRDFSVGCRTRTHKMGKNFTKGPYFRIKERRTGASAHEGPAHREVERVLPPCAPAVRKTKETGS